VPHVTKTGVKQNDQLCYPSFNIYNAGTKECILERKMFASQTALMQSRLLAASQVAIYTIKTFHAVS
jgi:hypothetical protein